MFKLLMYPFAHLDLMRCRLKWAYQRRLTPPPVPGQYIAAPIAAWLVRRGELIVSFHDGGEERCRPGEWIFPKEASGIQEYSGDLEILSIRFHAHWNHGEALFPRHETYRFSESEEPTLTASAVDLVASVERHAAQQADWSMSGDLPGYWEVQQRFLRWLTEWYQSMTRHGIGPTRPDALDPKVRSALELLQVHPLHLPLREAELAEKVGLSVSQLNKLFTARIGSTPAAFWQRRRLETAHARLIGSAQSIKAIAYELGFASPNYFTTWFRRHFRTTPTLLRQQSQTRPGQQPWV